MKLYTEQVDASIFDDAFYPHIRIAQSVFDYENNIISRRRCAEQLAHYLWSDISCHLTYDNQANVIFAMSDVVRGMEQQHPARQAVIMIINAYNAEHQFNPNGELYIRPSDLDL